MGAGTPSGSQFNGFVQRKSPPPPSQPTGAASARGAVEQWSAAAIAIADERRASEMPRGRGEDGRGVRIMKKRERGTMNRSWEGTVGCSARTAEKRLHTTASSSRFEKRHEHDSAMIMRRFKTPARGLRFDRSGPRPALARSSWLRGVTATEPLQACDHSEAREKQGRGGGLGNGEEDDVVAGVRRVTNLEELGEGSADDGELFAFIEAVASIDEAGAVRVASQAAGRIN